MNLLLATAPDVAAGAAAANEAYILWAIVALGIAIILVIIELFVPSGGLIAILAGAALVASLVAFFMYDQTVGAIALLIYSIVGPIVTVFVFKLWMASPMAKQMVLGGDSEDRFATQDEAAAASELARRDRMAQLRALIGVEGVTATALRPVGTVVIQGQRVDALAEEGIIDDDTAVIVVDVYDNQIKVRRRDG